MCISGCCNPRFIRKNHVLRDHKQPMKPGAGEGKNSIQLREWGSIYPHVSIYPHPNYGKRVVISKNGNIHIHMGTKLSKSKNI